MDWYDISNECDIFGMYFILLWPHSNCMVTIEINIQGEYREFEGKSLEEWYGKRYLKTQGVVGQEMKRNRSLKASFEESLNLEDDGFVKLQQRAT